ncbi:MAG TPA: hypothetical protein VF017_17185 [Thermoanaerobaculia bacterium]|nr:hypothetical protein [Thermoanaerobaculia bacterium]
MPFSRLLRSLRLGAVLALLASPAVASFHFMQIEQVIGGYCGSVDEQAIQLRMRSSGQNLVSGSKLIATDATGANPVTLITFPANVVGSSLGARILVTSAAFATTHGVTPDFTLTNLIPASYLPAGRLVFQGPDNIIYWSLAWGGAGYTGSNAGSTTNDADGNFGPAFATGLPFNFSQALLFPGAATALSTNNAADYAVTAGAATVTNNTGTGTTIVFCLFGDGFEVLGTGAWPVVVP